MDGEEPGPHVHLLASSVGGLAWASVAMGRLPSEAWLQIAESVVGARRGLEERLRPAELCSLAHSLSALGHRPTPSWMDRLYAATAEAMLRPLAGDSAATGPLAGEGTAGTSLSSRALACLLHTSEAADE